MRHEYDDEQIFESNKIAARTTGRDWISRFNLRDVRAILDALPDPPGKTYITNVGIQQQIGRLQDLTSSENEATIWLSTLNHLVATDADRKRILNQDTQDGWQECAWGDVLHTDERVKAEYISGTIIEGVPDGISDNGVYLVDGNFMPHSTDAKWYRIPAPVVHPDPTEHPHPEIEFDEVQKGDRIDVLTIYGNHEILTVEARTDSHLLAMGTQIPAENYAESIRLIDRPVVHPDPAEHPYIKCVHRDGSEYDLGASNGRVYSLFKDGRLLVQVAPHEITDWTPAKVIADE